MSNAKKVCGVDEAGRGAVIGPLVVAGVAVSEDAVQAIIETGAKDSKKLSKKKREQIYERLKNLGVEASYRLLEPEKVDSYTRRRGGPGINSLELEAIVSIAEELQPHILVVDSPLRNYEKLQAELSKRLNSIEIICRCHADSDYPVVGAASVVAKVIRDLTIAELSKTLGEIGSGYPSDPKTISYIRQLIAHGGLSREVRRSWRTIDRVMPRLTDYLDTGGDTKLS
ncbi:MAG: ribonuclease HII [Nitrososphaerota archaeon]